MDSKTVLVLLTLFSLSYAQITTDTFVEFRLSLREERIPAILNYLLNNSLDQITTSDIVKLSKLDQYGLDQSLEVLEFFNITENVFTVDNLEKFLQSLSYDFIDFFNTATAKLGMNQAQTVAALQNLEIPPEIWIALGFKNHDQIFENLRKGVYNEENINNALETVKSTRQGVFLAARDSVLDFVRKMDSTTFMTLLYQNGWDRRSAPTWFKALKITPEDVYQVETFRTIFSKITDELNENRTFGVFVAEKELAVHLQMYEQLEKVVDGITIKIEANGVEVVSRKDKFLGRHIVGLPTLQVAPEFIPVVSNYTPVENCTYYTIKSGAISKQAVSVSGFSVQKSPDLEFVLGSPLVCDGELYGLAHEQTEEEIVFDSFFTEDNPPPVDLIGGPEENAASSLSLNVAFVLIVFLLCVQ